MLIRYGFIAVFLLAMTGSVSAETETPRTRSGAAAAWSADGLQKVEIKGVDVAFARPGTSLAGYRRVVLRPPQVAFRRDWGRSPSGAGGHVRADDAQRIKERLAKLLTEELVREFAAGGYALVEQPDDDVIEVEVRIIDLNIVAPDVPTAGRRDVYAVSPGEMTLIAELRDSASGESIMRVYDHDEGDNLMRMRRITRMDNVAEATRLAKEWARILRRQLDAARVGTAP